MSREIIRVPGVSDVTDAVGAPLWEGTIVDELRPRRHATEPPAPPPAAAADNPDHTEPRRTEGAT